MEIIQQSKLQSGTVEENLLTIDKVLHQESSLHLYAMPVNRSDDQGTVPTDVGWLCLQMGFGANKYDFDTSPDCV